MIISATTVDVDMTLATHYGVLPRVLCLANSDRLAHGKGDISMTFGLAMNSHRRFHVISIATKGRNHINKTLLVSHRYVILMKSFLPPKVACVASVRPIRQTIGSLTGAKRINRVKVTWIGSKLRSIQSSSIGRLEGGHNGQK